MTHKFDLTLPSDMREINRAAALVAGFCHDHGLSGATERTLTLVVEELMTNSIQHGCPAEGAHIDVGLSFEGHRVGLRYADTGGRFDPHVDLPPDTRHHPVDERPVGGLGWPLILHYFELVHYRFRDGRNCYEFRTRVDEA